MEFVNFTPFPALPFVAVDRDDREHHVVVLRGTFQIVPEKPLRLAQEQRPLVMADQFHGEPNTSSLRYESDLAPFKPKTDVCLVATAHAPHGKPARRWDVAVRVGPHRKILSVTGPRHWKKGVTGFHLTEPERAEQVPITYERAYGGTIAEDEPRAGEEKPRVACWAFNPVGSGYYAPSMHGWLKRQREIPAPQVESLEDPVRELGRACRVEGLGPIGRAWSPRLRHAGTYDDAWLAQRWPRLPADFDPLYWNGAHPDLVLPRLRGDEEVVLVNLTPQGRTAFKIPGHVPFVLARCETGAILPFLAELDTLVIEPDALRVTLVWRALLPVALDVRLLEARLTLGGQRHG